MEKLIVKILKNRYVDSVSLMALSTQANQINEINQVIIAMATDMNKEVMANVGLVNDLVKEAQTSDLIITMTVDDSIDEEEVLTKVENLLDKKETVATSSVSTRVYHTIKDAAHDDKEVNLALISVNGHYAAREVHSALDAGLNVMMFSDNVSIQDEIELKDKALEKGLLMMGPDCGTAIINNIGLGFANKVRKGSIGIVGASGTGSQEISVRIHEFGGGISQMIGTGGRDLSTDIGGKMMLSGMDMLAEDDQTKVIVLISKPPAEEVKNKMISRAKEINKPIVVWFVGEMKQKQEGNVYFEDLSKNAALKALELSGVDLSSENLHPLNYPLIEEVKGKLIDNQQFIRGLFTGGTLASEAYYIAKESFNNVYTNTTNDASHQLTSLTKSKDHSFIDFGADEYTDGKPHPMIDPSTRLERFKQEARDPEVAVIVLDFVIGYGAHDNPVGFMAEDILKAKKEAEQNDRHLEIIGYVLGTELDAQGLSEQVALLEETGATYASSMQNAALLAREMVRKGE